MYIADDVIRNISASHTCDNTCCSASDALSKKETREYFVEIPLNIATASVRLLLYRLYYIYIYVDSEVSDFCQDEIPYHHRTVSSMRESTSWNSNSLKFWTDTSC